jgi:integrase
MQAAHGRGPRDRAEAPSRSAWQPKGRGADAAPARDAALEVSRIAPLPRTGSLPSYRNVSRAGRGLLPEGHVNPARGIERYKEHSRERFLTSEELSRLGDALREGETIGLPYAIDESSPKAKHAPKADKRRTKLDPFAAAAIRLLILTGARLREILDAKWQHADFERGILFLPDNKTGRKPVYLRAPTTTSSKPAAARRQSAHHRGHEGRRPARRSQEAMGRSHQSRRSQRPAHSRSQAFLRQCRRWRFPRASDHRQASRAHASGNHASLCASRR